jgi:hypothetical protein
MRGGETGSAEGEEEEGDLEAIAIAEVVDETSGAGSGAVNVKPSGEDILRRNKTTRSDGS